MRRKARGGEGKIRKEKRKRRKRRKGMKIMRIRMKVRIMTRTMRPGKRKRRTENGAEELRGKRRENNNKSEEKVTKRKGKR